MKLLTAIIVGAGHRAMGYGKYAINRPEELKIVGVADPDKVRRAKAQKLFSIPDSGLFETAEDVAKHKPKADFVINGTMDHLHVPTALPLLKSGYDMLLEKPFATNEKEMNLLVDTARKHKRKVAICHVLRYTPFYTAIRQRVVDGSIGDIVNIHAAELVSYHHTAVGFVRGKWNNRKACHSTFLMAKSSHDLDLIAWMKSGIKPTRVSSFGSNFQFRADQAPKDAGTRCLVDCPIEADCLYSAKKHYIDHPDRWAFYVWHSLEHIEKPTIEDKIASLKGNNPYGRCVWKCDNDFADHQAVNIEFEDRTTATLTLVGGCAKADRTMHIVGTRGEIQGSFEDSKFTVRKIDPRAGHVYSEEIVDLKVDGDKTGAFGGHGGGDSMMVTDFLRVLRGEKPSISSTSIDDSVTGHLIGFCADRSMDDHKVIDVAPKD